MKKYLLPQNGNFYKANLHCHTTISDGKLTPEQVKDEYMKRGYSIVAYTDHDVLISHSDLKDEGFLPLNGYEMEFTETEDKLMATRKTCHLCLIAIDPDNLTQVCYHRTKYAIGNGQQYRQYVKFDESLSDFEREHDADIINEAIKRAREGGFFVTYNHPTWSLENYSHYSKYENLNAMEMFNFSCIALGFNDINEKEYDDMLRCGKRIFCVGGDDNHNTRPMDSRSCGSFGGYTVIKAENLEYKTITDALVNGSFYASMGPEINELYFEDGYVNIKTSDADRIIMHTGIRPTFVEYAEEGKSINEARFEIKPEYGYIRISVFDKSGLSAQTNAYFVDELLTEEY